MTDKNLARLCDVVTEAHTRIQQNFSNLDPVVGVSQHMRTSGVPADAMTIDCLRSGKRIIVILHDQEPETVNYQYSFIDRDPDGNFERIQFSELTSSKVYEWIRDYFSVSEN